MIKTPSSEYVHIWVSRFALAWITIVGCSAQLLATDPVLEWKRILGTSTNEIDTAVSFDGVGNVYLSGDTAGSLAGPNAGPRDNFVAKYDTSGNQIWIRQFGTSNDDESGGVATDLSGSIYLTGSTQGNFAGTNAGSVDTYLAKYAADGNQVWKQQLGSSGIDGAFGASADNFGNVYISGGTSGTLGAGSFGSRDAFLAKYDSVGTKLWVAQVGTSAFDFALDVSANHAGDVFITGSTEGNLTGPSNGLQDAFVTKYDAAGTQQWSRQFGSSDIDQGTAVSADSFGIVYVAGITAGKIGDSTFGSQDGFVIKLDTAGNTLWAKQFGTNLNDRMFAVYTDALGNVYVGGAAANNPNGGPITDEDIYLRKFDSAGNLLWTYTVVETGIQEITSLSGDGTGTLYVAGVSSATSNPVQYDAFLLKLTEVPEPSALPLAVLEVVMIVAVAARRREQYIS